MAAHDESRARPSPWRWTGALLAYAAARSVESFVLALPPAAAERIARALGAAWFRLDRRRRATVLENLRIAFGDRSPEARLRIAKDACAHAFVVAVEAIRRPRVLRDARDYRRRGRYLGDTDAMTEDVRAGRAGVLLGGHVGNWEITGPCLVAEGVPFSFVARSLGNAHLDAHVASARGGRGAMIPKEGAVRAMRRALLAGRWVGMLPDQSAGRRGEFVPFFGTPASTFASGATVALREGRPIYFGAAMRRGPGFRYDYLLERYRGRATGDLREDARSALAAFHAFLEARVRERPEQYFWLHRRWKTLPQGQLLGPGIPHYPDHGRRSRRAPPVAPDPTTG